MKTKANIAKRTGRLVVFSLWSIGSFYSLAFSQFFSFILNQSFRVTAFAFLLLTILFLPSQSHYGKLAPEVKGDESTRLPVNLPPPAPYPVNLAKFPPPELTAGGVMIVDVASGVPLYQKNPEEKFQPASTTKIMTAMVALDYYQLPQVLEVKTVVQDGSRMGLVKGERLTAEALLYGLLVQSANDAAQTLSENYPGGTVGFVAAMNKKGEELHLVDSHFTNPIGFEEENHLVSTRDLVRLSLVAIKNPEIAKIAATRTITVYDETYSYFHDLVNVNKLLGRVPGIAGLKTGWTENAGECLVTLQVRDKGKILVVLLRSNNRFGETEKLLTWVGQNFEWGEVGQTASLPIQ